MRAVVLFLLERSMASKRRSSSATFSIKASAKASAKPDCFCNLCCLQNEVWFIPKLAWLSKNFARFTHIPF